MVNDIGVKTIVAIINELNNIIKKSPERSGKYHVHKGKVERRYYKNINENSYVYILDELLGIGKMEIIDFAIEKTPIKSKRESMKKAKRYISNNWEGIKSLFGEKNTDAVQRAI